MLRISQIINDTSIVEFVFCPEGITLREIR